MAIINFPILYLPDPERNRPLGLGDIQVGLPGLDPGDIPANQKQLNVVTADGTLVPVPQPFAFSAGGVPTYNGSYVRLDVDGDFSLLVRDRNGTQVYYIRNVYEGTPVIVEDLPRYVSAEFATVNNLVDGDSQNFGAIDWSDYLGRDVTTVVHNTTSNKGGDRYTIVNVNPGNLSSLVGGIWVGVNQDLGGGYYAKLKIATTLLADAIGCIPHPLSETSPSDSSAAINAGIDYLASVDSEGVLEFGEGSVYGYASNTYKEVTRGMEFRGQGRNSTRIHFSGTGGTYRAGTLSNMYLWGSQKGRPYVVNDIQWRQNGSDYVCGLYLCASGDDFGMVFHSKNFGGVFFNNTPVHIIRGFGVNLDNYNAIGNSTYDENSPIDASSNTDDAGIRLWGADGTAVVQEHFFSDNVTWRNCKITNFKYGVDGYGIIGDIAASSFEKCYVGFKNTQVAGVSTPTSSTNRAGGSKAAVSIGTGCYGEKCTAYYWADRDISDVDGSEINPSEAGSTLHFYGTSPLTGGPVEDAAFVGIDRHNPEALRKRLSFFTNYLGNLGGGSIPTGTKFLYSFQENPVKTWIDIGETLARFSIPDARFDGNLKIANPADTNNDHITINNDGAETILTSTHNYSFEFTTSSAGTQLSASGNWRPINDNTQNNGSASQRWAEIFAGNGTINTSDERDKTNWRDVNEAEKAAALEIKSMIKAYKWIDSVDSRGDSARWHFGVGAQSVGKVLQSHGLNPEQYSFYCYDEWEDEYKERVVSTGVFDDKGNEIDPRVIKSELTIPAGNRYGIRYNELIMFILAAI